MAEASEFSWRVGVDLLDLGAIGASVERKRDGWYIIEGNGCVRHEAKRIQ